MRPPVPVALAVSACLVLVGCGGDEIFPRGEFVSQVTARGVTKSVAECTYDKIVKDDAVMEDIRKADGPNDNISSRTDEKMSHVIAECILAADKPSTTKKPTTTTTVKKKRSSDDDDRTTTTRKARN
jgi:hypothetical protein